MAQAPPCPYCGASEYDLRDTRWILCQECGHEFDLRHDLCARCGYLNPARNQVCIHCQTPLREEIVDRIIQERGKGHLTWREERVAVAVEQKKQEEKASQQRMEAYWADENARREAQARARAEQRVRERRVLLVVIGVAAVLIVTLIAIVSILALLR